MKHNLIKSGLAGAFALALTASAALAQPGNFDGSASQQSGVMDGPLVQVRGGHGGGGGFHGGGFHGGFRRGSDGFDGLSYYGDDDYGYGNCGWSPRYHREICY